MNTYGEKGHIQQGWIMNNSKTFLNLNDIHQYIHQIYFQSVRSEDLYALKTNWKNLLKMLFQHPTSYLEEISLVCKLVLYTRDIHYGKGERKLSYMMLLALYESHEILGAMVFDYYVKKQPNKSSIGCWKDVKRCADYIIDETGNKDHGLINYMIEVSNIYLRSDYTKIVDIYSLFTDAEEKSIMKYIQNNIELTLVAKWMPRKSKNNRKYAWLFNKLADNMHKHYFKTVYKSKGKVDCKLLRRAINKSEMEYRKMLSFVNKHLNVVEILQTSNQTDEIDFAKVPSKARQQYHKSFLRKDGSKCKTNYTNYMLNQTYIHSTCYLYEIVKNVIDEKLWDNKPCELNRQIAVKMWRTKKMVLNRMENIAVVDMSISMGKIALYNAIALGIYIAEHNTGDFKNKLIVFGNRPRLVSFNNQMDICDKIQYIMRHKNNINSDLYSVFDRLLQTVAKNNLSKNELKSTSITILSDMQIEPNSSLKHYCLYSNIYTMFKHYDIEKPQIIFWNLKQTNGFPMFNFHNYNEIIMFSGYSEKVLEYFKGSNKETKKVKDSNHFLLFNILSNKKYDFINMEVLNIFLVNKH